MDVLLGHYSFHFAGSVQPGTPIRPGTQETGDSTDWNLVLKRRSAQDPQAPVSGLASEPDSPNRHADGPL